MPIRVECPACRAAFQVKDEYAGKRGKCPQCREALDIPAPAPAARRPAEPEEDETYALAGAGPRVRPVAVRATPGGRVARAIAPTRPSQTPAQILAAFGSEIEPVRPTALYRTWIVVVAATMVLLPVFYVALGGFLLGALAYHAVHNVTLFETVKNNKAAFLAYAGPLIGGGVALAFMFKPLFARPGKRPQTRALDPSKEPLIFAFVDGVCASVGSPRPVRIEVDCQVNASAHRAGGALALFKNDLVLTIGLPLAAGLDLKQFAGVLAHEFGHFSQGAGMRLSTLIRTINLWFVRVVYERDAWDETVVGWTKSGNNYAILIGLIARAAVWLTRRLLWVLMVLGHAASGFLLRQMEFDADRYEARMVGADVFAATSRRLRVLGLASQGAYADLASSWEDRRLPDDLPKLILANVEQIPEPVLGRLRAAEEGQETGLFDTHPADRERIARAEADAPEGIFALEGPATDLFGNFDALARVTTFDHYRALLGPEISKDQLYPVAEALHGRVAAVQAHEAFDRFFLNALGGLQPLPLPANYPTVPADLKAAKRALVECRTEMELLKDGNQAAHARWQALHQQAVRGEVAAALIRAGNKIKAADYGLDDRTLDAAEAAVASAEAGLRALDKQSYGPFERAAGRRLVTALALLEAEAVVGRVAEGRALRDEARALYPCVVALIRLAPDRGLVLRSQHAVIELAQAITGGKAPNHPGLNNGLVRLGQQLHDRLVELRWKIGDGVAYPFEHAQEDITLAGYALPVVPPKDEIGALAHVGGDSVDKLGGLYRRVLGRLAVTAEEVERALGLQPLFVDFQPA